MNRRREALRQSYAARVAPAADPLVRAARQHGRALLQGLGGVVIAWLVAAGLLYWFEWPVAWWSDPAALVRIALAVTVVGGAWLRFTRRGTPRVQSSSDVAARLEAEILPMAFDVLRPSAAYAATGAIDRAWIRRSALIDGVRDYTCAHLLSWQTDRSRRQLAQVEALRQSTNRDGDTTTHVVFKGLVAIAELPVAVPGHVRVWASDLFYEPPGPVSGLPPVARDTIGAARPGLPSTTRLDDAYEIGASAPDLAAVVVSADVVTRLNAAHRAGHRVRIAIAHRELVVACDRRRQWFRSLALNFGEERFVEMGEVLDLVDDLAAAVVRAMGRPA